MSNIREIVTDCLEASDYDRDLAVKRAREIIEADQALYAALVDPLINRAIRDIAHNVSAKKRDSYHHSHAEPRLDGLIAVAKLNWLEYPIYGGKPLGDAMPSDIAHARDAYYQLAEENRVRGAFMERLLTKLKSTSKPVRKQLTHEDIDRVFLNVQNAA